MQGGSKVTHCDRRCNQDQVLVALLIEVGLEVIGDALGETSLQFPVRIGPALCGVYGTALGLEAATRSAVISSRWAVNSADRCHVIDLNQLRVIRYGPDDRYVRTIGYDDPSSAGSHLNRSQALPVGG